MSAAQLISIALSVLTIHRATMHHVLSQCLRYQRVYPCHPDKLKMLALPVECVTAHQLRVVTDETLVDIRELACVTAKYPSAVAIAGKIRVAFNGD